MYKTYGLLTGENLPAEEDLAHTLVMIGRLRSVEYGTAILPPEVPLALARMLESGAEMLRRKIAKMGRQVPGATVSHPGE